MNRKILYLELLRLFACFFVIVNHTHGLMLANNNIINTIIYCVDFSLCKIAVPIFFMIISLLLYISRILREKHLFPYIEKRREGKTSVARQFCRHYVWKGFKNEKNHSNRFIRRHDLRRYHDRRLR